MSFLRYHGIYALKPNVCQDRLRTNIRNKLLQNDEPFHFSCAGEDYWMSARHQRTEDDEAWEVSLSW